MSLNRENPCQRGVREILANGGVPEMDNTVPSFKNEEGVTTKADECKLVGMKNGTFRSTRQLVKVEEIVYSL